MRKLISMLLLTVGLALTAGAQSTKKAPEKKAVAGEILDINSATADQLKTIPGIGEAYSAAIIKGRPYQRKDELVAKKILPQGVYDKVKDQLIAKQRGAKK